ncbi:MAG: DUF3108 domain-containing protein [Salibacteraceae bacterium]
MNKKDLNPQFILGIFFILFSPSIFAQHELNRDLVFKHGEKVSYEIFYQWGFIWVDAGEVSFSINVKQFQDSQATQFYSEGKTHAKWDWMYRVRDIYASTVVSDDKLSPINFERKVSEGGTFIHNKYDFDVRNKVIYSQTKTKEKSEFNLDTLKYQDGVYDVTSMIYRARQFDYENKVVNEKIPIKLLLDNEIHDTHIEYLGIEEISISGKGKIECYKFKPLLIEGTIFSAGDEMTVWVSKDLNRVPIMVETPILVGSIKVFIREYENLVHPLQFNE